MFTKAGRASEVVVNTFCDSYFSNDNVIRQLEIYFYIQKNFFSEIENQDQSRDHANEIENERGLEIEIASEKETEIENATETEIGRDGGGRRARRPITGNTRSTVNISTSVT